MKIDSLHNLSVAELVARFADVEVAQFQAERLSDIRKQNECVTEAMAIADELKARPGDQRTALLELHGHPNVQVQLMAAKLTFAIAPATARALIESIARSKKYPQAGDAGMCLWALDQGIFIPT
ncbi:MAG: DUF2019 domain-containing protein [Pseudolabrys sp.]